jgi:hypothetical protein
VIPAADRVRGEALDLPRELHAAVQALVADPENSTADALQEDALTEELYRSHFLLGDVLRKQGRVPVIAEAIAGSDVPAPRHPIQYLVRDETLGVTHVYSRRPTMSA